MGNFGNARRHFGIYGCGNSSEYDGGAHEDTEAVPLDEADESFRETVGEVVFKFGEEFLPKVTSKFLVFVFERCMTFYAFLRFRIVFVSAFVAVDVFFFGHIDFLLSKLVFYAVFYEFVVGIALFAGVFRFDFFFDDTVFVF